MEGPAVADLAKMFVSSIREAGYPDVLEAESDNPPVTPVTVRKRKQESSPTDIPAMGNGRNAFVQILESNVRYGTIVTN